MESQYKFAITLSAILLMIAVLCFGALLTEQNNRHRCVLEAVKTMSVDDANKICK